MGNFLILIVMLALVCELRIVCANDHAPLQDFCVTDCTNSVRVNGYARKDPKDVQAEDFFVSGLHLTPKEYAYNNKSINPGTLPLIRGLNTLGISMASIDFLPYGVNTPHIHPRATEILTVLEGSLEAGFVTSNPENRHIYKVLNKGDVFVIPIGLVHYQLNVNNEHAVVLVVWSSQNPGMAEIPKALFGTKPEINTDILAKAFHVDNYIIDQILARFNTST